MTAKNDVNDARNQEGDMNDKANKIENRDSKSSKIKRGVLANGRSALVYTRRQQLDRAGEPRSQAQDAVIVGYPQGSAKPVDSDYVALTFATGGGTEYERFVEAMISRDALPEGIGGKTLVKCSGRHYKRMALGKDGKISFRSAIRAEGSVEILDELGESDELGLTLSARIAVMRTKLEFFKNERGERTGKIAFGLAVGLNYGRVRAVGEKPSGESDTARETTSIVVMANAEDMDESRARMPGNIGYSPKGSFASVSGLALMDPDTGSVLVRNPRQFINGTAVARAKARKAA